MENKQGINVLLAYANSSMDNLIPLGTSLLSACLKEAGHNVKLFDTTFYKTKEETGDDARVKTLQVKKTDLSEFGISPKKTDMKEDFKKVIKDFRPDLIGVSVIETTYNIGLNLLKATKNQNIPTIMGGIHVTFSLDDVINEDCVDMVCAGEGEDALVELANNIGDNKDYSKIKNLWVKKNGKIIKNGLRPLKNLDELPFQDWDIYEKKRFYKPMGGEIKITGSFEMDRGCPYSCTFCCNESLNKLYSNKYHRKKSIKRLIDEIKFLKEEYNIQYAYIVAESLLSSKKERLDEFFRSYKELNLPFWIESRPDSITEEKVKSLEEIGCESISIGVESGNDELRRNLLNRYVSNEKIVKAFKILKKSKIRTCANNIIGFPTETRKQVFDTIELNREIGAKNIIVNIFSPYRGTRLQRLCVEKGYISKNSLAGDYRCDAVLDMPQLSKTEVLGLQRTFPLYVKFPKDMWSEIKKCEKFDEEGDRIFNKLSKIYTDKYL